MGSVCVPTFPAIGCIRSRDEREELIRLGYTNGWVAVEAPMI